MQDTTIFERGGHDWVVFGRDPGKPDKVIDTNQYMVRSDGQAILLDSGGIELIAPMLASIVRHVPADKVVGLFRLREHRPPADSR